MIELYEHDTSPLQLGAYVLLTISYIIVNWNVRDHLLACLESISATPDRNQSEVVVVDNASDDDSVEVVERCFSGVHVVRNDRNMGFGRACQIGIEHTTSDWIVLLNPDARLSGGSMRAFLSSYHQDETVALVGPAIWSGSDLQSGPFFLPNWSSLIRALPFGSRLKLHRNASSYDTASPARVCEYLYGACLCIRRSALEDVGGFPTLTFMYGEELLLGFSLRAKGYRAVYDPSYSISHVDDASSSQRWSSRESEIVRKEADVAVRQIVMPRFAFLCWNSIMLLRNLSASLSPNTWPGRRHSLRLARINAEAFFSEPRFRYNRSTGDAGEPTR